MKPTNDQVRASIDATLGEIEMHSRNLGLPPERADYEAFDVLARIEVRLAQRHDAAGEAA